MAGHVHDVGRYAPEGCKLLVSNYEGGKVTHVFGLNDTRLECVVGPHDDEEATLAAFQAAHAPKLADVSKEQASFRQPAGKPRKGK